MESMVIQPVRQDMEAIFQDHDVQNEMRNNIFLRISHWHFFLITGMIIAKGRKRMISGESKSGNSRLGLGYFARALLSPLGLINHRLIDNSSK